MKPKPTYAIYRILGNELPPRDLPGARLAALERILAEEPAFPDTIKWWVVNWIHAPDQAAAVVARLVAAKQRYLLLPPNGQVLMSAPLEERAVIALNINGARNIALAHGKLQAEFTVLLDGDCMFMADQFAIFNRAVEADGGSHRYYSIATVRGDATGRPLAAPGEHMVAFRHDSEEVFDPNRVFGDNDKRQLLYRLGHKRTHALELPRWAKSHSAGEVTHLATGEEAIERNVEERRTARRMSIEAIMAGLERRYSKAPTSRIPLSRNDWESIPGLFNYWSFMTHSVATAPADAKFVQVGVSRGRSTAYLAQTIRDSKKAIHLDVVDTWTIDPDASPDDEALLHEMEGVDRLYDEFLSNMQSAGVSDLVRAVRLPSVEAAAKYANDSLDFVFIDGDHSYPVIKADLAAWLPKIKTGGILAGYGYCATSEGVLRAVDEFIDGALEIRPAGNIKSEHARVLHLHRGRAGHAQGAAGANGRLAPRRIRRRSATPALWAPGLGGVPSRGAMRLPGADRAVAQAPPDRTVPGGGALGLARRLALAGAGSVLGRGADCLRDRAGHVPPSALADGRRGGAHRQSVPA
jgi:predicted O-methyltransferase YrrM